MRMLPPKNVATGSLSALCQRPERWTSLVPAPDRRRGEFLCVPIRGDRRIRTRSAVYSRVVELGERSQISAV